MASHERLSEQYDRRFGAAQAYRDGVWTTLLQSRLQDWVGRDKRVLDLGCGWGEFVRNVQAAERYAMDLNPDAAGLVGEGVAFLHQDCSQPWPLEDASLDVIFSSNFLEHLPDKPAIESTLIQARRCLRPDGQIILMGPNIRFTGGAYWDFWDHHVALTDRSISELLELSGFRVTQCIPRFMPFTMSDGREPPLFLVRVFLALPLAWPILGRQFLVRAQAI
jgi:SAM-dependent methyltransferase